jgi:hypothetical protein
MWNRSGTASIRPMKAKDIKDWVKKRPFQRFIIHVSDGRDFQITHPDQIMVFYHKVIVGLERDERGILDQSEELAMRHITSIQETKGNQDGTQSMIDEIDLL